MGTIAIIDYAHSGTTMLAGMLEIMGVPMVGEDYREVKWEDMEIVNALLDGEEDLFRSIVRQRDEQHEVWGFKFPGVWLYAELLDECLIDPIYLAIYKDPVSTTKRRFGRGDVRFTKRMLNTLRQQVRSVERIRATRWEVHFFSYLRAVLTPEAFADELIRATCLMPTEEARQKAINYIQPNLAGPRAHYPKVKEWI